MQNVKTEPKDAIELAMIATGAIDADNEKESMRIAREDVRCIAKLFGLDAESLWKAAFDRWYEVARNARDLESE